MGRPGTSCRPRFHADSPPASDRMNMLAQRSDSASLPIHQGFGRSGRWPKPRLRRHRPTRRVTLDLPTIDDDEEVEIGGDAADDENPGLPALVGMSRFRMVDAGQRMLLMPGRAARNDPSSGVFSRTMTDNSQALRDTENQLSLAKRVLQKERGKRRANRASSPNRTPSGH